MLHEVKEPVEDFSKALDGMIRPRLTQVKSGRSEKKPLSAIQVRATVLGQDGKNKNGCLDWDWGVICFEGGISKVL